MSELGKEIDALFCQLMGYPPGTDLKQASLDAARKMVDASHEEAMLMLNKLRGAHAQIALKLAHRLYHLMDIMKSTRDTGIRIQAGRDLSELLVALAETGESACSIEALEDIINETHPKPEMPKPTMEPEVRSKLDGHS